MEGEKVKQLLTHKIKQMEQTVTQQELAILNPIDAALSKENVTAKVIAELRKSLTIKIKDINDKENYAVAKRARIECKNLRVLAVKICKSGREEAIQIQKQWIAKEKEVVSQIEEVENYLQGEQDRIDNEKEAIRLQAEREAAERIQNRVKLLFDNGCSYDGVNYSILETTINDTQLKVMDDNIFSVFMDKVKVEHQRELEMKEQAEKERLAEVARIEAEKKAEAERMQKEREELEAQQAKFKAEQEASRKLQEEAQAKMQAENERIAKEQREKQEELTRQAKAIQDAKDEAERIERERLLKIETDRIAAEKETLRIEAERLAAIEAENKRISEEAEAAEQARIEQERQAALAPDKEKLLTLAESLSTFALPEMKTEAGIAILDEVVVLLQKVNAHITKKVKSL